MLNIFIFNLEVFNDENFIYYYVGDIFCIVDFCNIFCGVVINFNCKYVFYFFILFFVFNLWKLVNNFYCDDNFFI